MANKSELHVVLGASGNLGSAVVRELVKQGKPVRMIGYWSPNCPLTG